MFRLGTILFSLSSLPILSILIINVSSSAKGQHGLNRATALTLLSLFIFLFAVSVFSFLISLGSILEVGLSVHYFSVFRSFFFSLSNFIVSMFFYKIVKSK